MAVKMQALPWLLVVLALQGAFCQDAAEPTAALDPVAAAELMPQYVSPTPQESLALVPLSESAKADLVDKVLAGVDATKSEVKQALSNPTAAFEQYTAKWASGEIAVADVPAPGSVADTKTLAQRKRIFQANLQAEFKKIMLPMDLGKQYAANTPTIEEAGSPGRKLMQACTKAKANPYTTGTPPAGVNWVTANMLTPIRDQGECGSCTAFATTAIAEFCHIKKTKAIPSTVDFSEQELLDCTTGNQCNGAAVNAYFGKIICSGMAKETAAPYRAADNDTCTNPARSLVGMTGWAVVATNSIIALALAVAKAPTLIAVDATYWGSYSSGIFDCNAGPTINHAVVAVGYVNGVTVGTTKLDYWIIRNSWSQGWGGGNNDPYKGYVFVRKDCAGTGSFSMYQSNPIVPIAG